jgi:hypothetical protein
MKLLVTVLFLTGFSLAQTKADFSGIFLRTRSEVQGHPEPAVPRILEVKQTAEEVVVTATQNGETAVARFRLHDNKSDTVQGRLKGKNLLLKTTVPRQWPVTGLIGPSLNRAQEFRDRAFTFRGTLCQLSRNCATITRRPGR